MLQDVTQDLGLGRISLESWHVRSLCMSGALKTVAPKLAKSKLHVAGALQVR